VRLRCFGGDDIDETPLFAIALAVVSGLSTSLADRLGLVALVKTCIVSPNYIQEKKPHKKGMKKSNKHEH
jgi:hypothetical protein